MKFLNILTALILIIAIGCSGNQKDSKSIGQKKSKKENTQNSKEVSPKTVASFEGSLNKKESRGLRQIHKKFSAEIKELKNQNKWSGDKNKKIRKSLNNRKEQELKSFLGDKYEAYIASQAEKRAQNKKK